MKSTFPLSAAFCALLLLFAATFPAVGEDVPALLTVTGQVLDAEGGFLFLTTGDGFRVDKHAKLINYSTKEPISGEILPRQYARLTFDPATGNIVSIEISQKILPKESDYTLVKKFAVAVSPQTRNPDLATSTVPVGKSSSTFYREPLDGKPVVVTFIVQVPPTTDLTSSVYISTDQSGWNPEAIRMDRVDALHYRAVRNLNSGTIFHYRYTRGTQTTVERGQNGLEQTPRLIEITNLDIKTRDDIVYHWSDETLSGQAANPLAVPTPFNPNPFGNLPQNPLRPKPTPPPA